jgi:hypothetical protein
VQRRTRYFDNSPGPRPARTFDSELTDITEVVVRKILQVNRAACVGKMKFPLTVVLKDGSGNCFFQMEYGAGDTNWLVSIDNVYGKLPVRAILADATGRKILL